MTYIHFTPYYIYFCNKDVEVMEEKEKKERTVIHLYIKENDTHHYFGSIANIFEYFSSEELGITYGSLRNYGLLSENPYQNAKCIIRKGILLAKSGNRGKNNNKI